MKKIILLVSLMVGSFSFGQTVLIDRPSTNTGLVSDYWDNDEAGVYSADYFVLENPVEISSITFNGFTNIGDSQLPIDGLMLDFNVYFFSNNSGMPLGDPENADEAVLAFPNIDLVYVTIDDGGTNSSHITVDFAAANGGEAIILPAGEYWMSAFPTVELSDPIWRWLGSPMDVGNDAMLIDPDDLFGAEATDWTPIFLLTGEEFPSFSWLMMGEEVLSVADNVLSGVSIYPNPATDILNIQTPANITVESVSMFDILGKNVNVNFTNGTVNTSALSKGVYILQVNTNQGTLTQKVVKQ